MGFFDKILKFIAKASIPTFKFEDNKLHFKVKSEEYYEYDLGTYDIKTRHDPFIMEAYTLNTQDIFLEYIRVDHNTQWNGQALSLFEGFFVEKLNIRDFETIEKKDIEHYTFKTYRINESFVIHSIAIYTVVSDIIILDTKGDLYKNLLFRLDGNYQYKFDKEEKGDINFNISMVKENCFKGFFSASD
ncbi:hypothetical protein [Arcobacter sp. LA11]|uniref:hypothetical protein n=1 Tax=Arcobacter sp. LA11 TaxID=1898176 RepID=UPI00093269D3|nr:hypothetical protein [Arcobacter sp. LA11]